MYTENTENCFQNLEFLITPVGRDTNIEGGSSSKEDRLQVVSPWFCWAASDNAVLCQPSRETSPITFNFYIVMKEKQKAWPILMLAHSDTSDNPGQPRQRGPGAKSTREKASSSYLA